MKHQISPFLHFQFNDLFLLCSERSFTAGYYHVRAKFDFENMQIFDIPTSAEDDKEEHQFRISDEDKSMTLYTQYVTTPLCLYN